MWLKIYFGTVLFGMIPYAAERTIFDIRLKKDGYKLVNDDEFKYELIDTVLDIVPFFIPVINVFKGIKYYVRLIKNKFYYSLYKGRLLIDGQIVKNNDKELNEDEIYTEMYGLSNNLINGLPIPKEDKENIRKTLEICDITIYLKDNGCKFDIDANMPIDEIYDYVKGLKEEFDSKKDETEKEQIQENKSKSFDEMTNQEKIDYLRREKEDVINYQNQKEMVLEKKREKNERE